VHILTKIFIVLVTLAAVAMVPLVAVYTVNDDSWRAKYQKSENERRLVSTQLAEAQQALIAERAQMQQEIDGRDVIVNRLQREQSDARTRAETIQSQAGQLRAELAQCNANMQALAAASDVNSRIKERFVTENYDLRDRIVDAEQAVMEIEDKLRQVRSEYETASAAERKAREERHRLQKELASLQTTIDTYVARYGEIDAVADSGAGVAPDRTLTATILAVAREGGAVLAEINAGSRDGIQEDWIMTIGQDGTFLGRFQVEEVDINRSIGRVTLESEGRGLVSPGATAYAIKGRD
jgi:archaellum component FlaC